MNSHCISLIAPCTSFADGTAEATHPSSLRCGYCGASSSVGSRGLRAVLRVVTLDVRHPFEKEPDFKATSVNYGLSKLLAQAGEPA